MRILGVDPGLVNTGYAVIEQTGGRLQAVEGGVITTKSADPLAERLHTIFGDIREVISRLRPDAMAIEDLHSRAAFVKTAILMGHARGVICLAAAEAGVAVVPYSATQIKKVLTGNGRAPKSQMQLAIQRELALAAIPDPPDVADALAVALCHYYLRVRRTLATQRPA